MSGDAPQIEPTAMETANVELALKQWEHYKRQAVPLEKRYMGMVRKMNSTGEYDRASGLAQAGVMEQYEPQIQKAKAAAVEAGLTPGSGAFLASMAGVRGKGAEALGQAGTGARIAQHDRYIAGLENILDIGRAQAATAQQGMMDAAQHQVDATKSRLQAQWESDQAMGQAVGAAAGMAARPLVDKSVYDYTRGKS